MKLKDAITLSTITLITMLGTTDLYARQKEGKKCRKTGQNCQKPNYDKPSEVKANEGAFKIRPLAYDYDAVSSYTDAETMYIHFSKHYIRYLNNLNKAVGGKPEAQETIEQLLSALNMSNATLRNSVGGYCNYNLYFEFISPKRGGTPTGALTAAVDRDFGSFENFKGAFNGAGAERFGPSWAWLVVNNGKLQVVSTANRDTSLMPNLEVSGTPTLAMDVREHACYLKYQNKCTDYITNFFNVTDWTKVTQKYEEAPK